MVVPGGVESEEGRGHVIQTDKRRLERIVVNLVDNALHHGAPPVLIRVRSETGGPDEEGVVEISVEDQGAGISPEHLPHVFDRFYKADPSRASSRGSGLGLAIARQNARLLSGDLTAANLPEGGARFVLTLPDRTL